MKRLDKWAAALKLEGKELHEFMDLAAIEHMPPEARPRFLKLYREMELMKTRIHTLESRGKDGNGNARSRTDAKT